MSPYRVHLLFVGWRSGCELPSPPPCPLFFPDHHIQISSAGLRDPLPFLGYRFFSTSWAHGSPFRLLPIPVFQQVEQPSFFLGGPYPIRNHKVIFSPFPSYTPSDFLPITVRAFTGKELITLRRSVLVPPVTFRLHPSLYSDHYPDGFSQS